MNAKFVILEPKPVVLDREALSVIEAEQLRDEQRRHDEFFARLAARDPRRAPPVRVL